METYIAIPTALDFRPKRFGNQDKYYKIHKLPNGLYQLILSERIVSFFKLDARKEGLTEITAIEELDLLNFGYFISREYIILKFVKPFFNVKWIWREIFDSLLFSIRKGTWVHIEDLRALDRSQIGPVILNDDR